MASKLPVWRTIVGLFGAVAVAGGSNCTSFRFDDYPGAALLGTTLYEQGARVNITNEFSSINTDGLPSFCRVELQVTTNASAGSYAITELWLPDAWNGRFLGFGNGGIGGGVNVADLGYVAITHGFAGMSTDTGHNSSAVDGSWAGPGNDNAIIDWSWRAMHLSVEVGKAVVESYYGNSAAKSYYLGCSTGGRQGLKEIQRFPENFDGVVLGSPANWLSHLAPWSVHLALDALPVGSPHSISDDLWVGLIHDEVLRQCDGIDGVSDGIINDPRVCNFRPETLACRPGQNTATCLNLDQIQALHRVYSDYYETNQTYIFGPYYPGGETGYIGGMVGTAPALGLSTDVLKYFVLNDTTWDYTTLNYDVIKLAEQVFSGTGDAIDANLTAFAGPSHSGKVIHYVGWADQIISPGNSLHYYETVHAFMQAETGMEIDDYYRLFTVPGMQHCQGGYGANAFGGSGQAAGGMPPTSYNPENDVVSAIVAWVENGTAPDSFIASYYNNNDFTQGVNFSRPICKYPRSLRYTGGDVDAPTSFACV
ncbi:feruloyl esterase-like protein [Gloeophyllum trabeum ATCC 11539]|uniref:Carboxylic ester hydrolase n=1 Tax=Gloeophyllum trabeum (strain ATCC 11539 / FP-39264 / Madison 617) TaxID=670483 RepID=S7Q6K4_GLOTA|nr:feruloyl esterase-like protein [Gloeophyllum trabeum ATCC 11539]EPQ55147.1 feruloyl esterase-like protein [Gloeophyllum trabeum ATCC 11539]